MVEQFTKNRTKRLKNLLRGFALAVFIAFVSIVVLIYMTQRVPDSFSSYTPPAKTEQVSEYLTHYLAPRVHNNIQVDEPFAVVVPEEGINEIIAEEKLLGWQWPVEVSKVQISRPVAFFTEDSIKLMGRIKFGRLNSVVTICASPKLDEQGMLSLNLRYIRAGAVDISFLVKKAIKNVIEEQIDVVGDQYWLRDILAACEDNEPFEPVFPTIYGEYIRLVGSKVDNQKLVLVFEPGTYDHLAGTSISESRITGLE